MPYLANESGLGWAYKNSPSFPSGSNQMYVPVLRGPITTGQVWEYDDDGNLVYGNGNGLGAVSFFGDFSLQTVALIAGVGLIGWLLLSKRGGREYEYRTGVVAAKARGNSIKKKVDSRVRELEGQLDNYRKTGQADMGKLKETGDLLSGIDADL